MPDLEYLFHPSSIAVVGASPDPYNSTTMFLLNPLIQFGYEGKIYPIHPKADEMSGLKAYPSILDVPDTIDYVICAIKSASTPQLMKECVSKKVKVMHLFTSGFSETGEKDKVQLEKEITEIAHQGGVRVIGPYCMGIYCPNSRISFNPNFPKEGGSVGLLCQSGGNSMELVQLGATRDIYFSKVVSFGNAADLNEADFLEYLARDPQTKIIIGYIEGTKDGRRFINALQEAARAKPVIMAKGGMTEAGIKAAASHTGALAGSSIIWDSLFNQLGVMQIYDFEEIIDLVSVFQYFNPVGGKKAGLIGVGGGSSVVATDSCEREGLIVPPLPGEVRDRLREVIPEEVDPGTSVRNPVDLSISGWNPDIYSAALETIADYDGIDFILTYTTVAFGLFGGSDMQINMQIKALIKAKRNSSKPVAIVLRHSGAREAANNASDIQEVCLEAGIPVFPSFDRAARAINRFIRYNATR